MPIEKNCDKNGSNLAVFNQKFCERQGGPPWREQKAEIGGSAFHSRCLDRKAGRRSEVWAAQSGVRSMHTPPSTTTWELVWKEERSVAR